MKLTPLTTSSPASGYWKATSRNSSSPRTPSAGVLGLAGSRMELSVARTSSTRSQATSARGIMTETIVRIMNDMTICMV